MTNILKIQVSNYEGATVEINTERNSKHVQDYFARELQPERFKVWETIARQSYFIGNTQVITAPLDNVGYLASESGDDYIFVNSKLPKATRSKIIRHFLRQRKKEHPE